MRINPVLVAVFILVIGFAIPGIRVFHHLEIPTLNKYRIIHRYEMKTSPPFIDSIYDITLEQGIHAPLYYEDISKVLREASRFDTIVFHLIGYGGAVNTTAMLINQIHESRGFIIMKVEGPVYSAHAYLALSGDKLEMAPDSYLMLHYSSVLNLDCTGVKGEDRGVSKATKCLQFKNAEIDLTDNVLQGLSYVTSTERVRLKAGEDIYLSPQDIANRGN